MIGECVLDLLASISTERSVDAVALLLTDDRWAHPACTVLLNNPSNRAAEALHAAVAVHVLEILRPDRDLDELWWERRRDDRGSANPVWKLRRKM